MAVIPIDIVNIAGSAGMTNGIISGKIEGDIKGRVTLTGELCHGLQLGITGQVAGQIAGNATLLFIGAKAQGQLSAEAGAKVLVRLEPNLFDKMGLVVEAGAYAFAAAAGSLAVYLTPEFFARYIQDHLDDFTADLFLIFLEELEAEVGVWGKVAVAAMAEGHINIIIDVRDLDSGFEISGGGNIGLKAGGGYDFYCRVGFKNLRRAIYRSTLRINEEILSYLRPSDLPQAPLLATAFDFTFPLVVMIAYDLGRESYEKKALVQPAEIATIVSHNFIHNLQRFGVDQLSRAAVRWLTEEFSKLYYQLAGIELSQSELNELQEEVHRLLEILQKGDFRLQDINEIVSGTINVIDLVDGGFLDPFKQPLTIFWLSSMLGLLTKELLAEFFVEIGVSSSAVGSLGIEAAADMLPSAPELVREEISRVLDTSVLEVDVSYAVDYLIEVGISEVLDRYVPEVRSFRDTLHTTFSVSEGEIIEDVLNLLIGRGAIGDLNTYGAIKQFVKAELLDGLVMGQLLPYLKQQSDLDAVAEYLDEVVEPSIHTVSTFVFSKLDQILIDDLHQMSEDRLLQMMDSMSTGCGIVVYQVLVRNILFFDDIVTNFILDHTYQGFRTLRHDFENPQHPLFVSVRHLFEQGLPGHPPLAQHTEALQTLLYDMSAAFEHVFGPTIHTPQRRARIQELKRTILLSIGGKYDLTQELMPEAAIEEMIDCLHIPNLNAVQELAGTLTEISIETFLVFVNRIAPSLADFFLAITLEEFRLLRKRLNAYIDSLLEAAELAIEAYEILADYIRENILDLLDGLETFITSRTEIIRNHLEGDWAETAKASIQARGIEIVRENTDGAEAEEAAVIAFMTVDWLIINPILDAAFMVLNTTLGSFLDTLDELATDNTDAAAAFVEWQAEQEEQLIEDLEGMIIIPAAETARIILDTLFPESLIDTIEQYLIARQDQKALEVEKHEKEAELILLEAEKAEQEQRLRDNAHQPALSLEILNPLPEFDFIYPASVEVLIVMNNGSAAFINDPESRRIQLMLNAQPLPISPEQWQFNSDTEQYELSLIFEPGRLDMGLNVLELSWISGREEANTRRRAVSFLVDTDVYYPREDFSVSVLADPPGRDVDHEYVQIEWRGDADLDLTQWLLVDKANHRYRFPEVVLRPNDRVRIYTGGNSSQNKTEGNRKNKVLYMGRRKAVWNNNGDVVYLADSNSVIARTFSYAGV